MSKLFDFNNDIPLGIQYGDYDSRLISSSQEFKKLSLKEKWVWTLSICQKDPKLTY